MSSDKIRINFHGAAADIVMREDNLRHLESELKLRGLQVIEFHKHEDGNHKLSLSAYSDLSSDEIDIGLRIIYSASNGFYHHATQTRKIAADGSHGIGPTVKCVRLPSRHAA